MYLSLAHFLSLQNGIIYRNFNQELAVIYDVLGLWWSGVRGVRVKGNLVVLEYGSDRPEAWYEGSRCNFLLLILDVV
jgi:hypothetical protein